MNVDVCSYPTLLSLLCYRARSVPSLTLRSMYLRSVADPGRDRDRAAPPPHCGLEVVFDSVFASERYVVNSPLPRSHFRLSVCLSKMRVSLSKGRTFCRIYL